MADFLRILHAKIYYSRFTFNGVIQKRKVFQIHSVNVNKGDCKNSRWWKL